MIGCIRLPDEKDKQERCTEVRRFFLAFPEGEGYNRAGGMNMKRHQKGLIAVTAVILAVALGIGVYVGDYYHTDMETSAALLEQLDYRFGIRDGFREYAPTDGTYSKGLIFYPGGKVEHTAYEPLLAACAEQGILCVLVEMPCNLAVLDMNAAEDVLALYPEIEEWYIAGHSLGGSMAASFAAGCEEIDGVILLAAYSTEPLNGKQVLSVRAGEDQVMNREKYDQYRSNLPEDTIERMIQGGCHAGFGVYGPQDGDGQPTVSTEEQIRQTADAIIDFMK